MHEHDATQGLGPGPRSPGRIVAATFQVYVRNAPRIVVIAAAVMVPLLIAGWAAFGPDFMGLLFSMPGGTPPATSETDIASIAVYSVLYALGLLAVTGATAEAGAGSLTGVRVSVALAYSAARYWRPPW
jgi:hypothetical protein